MPTYEDAKAMAKTLRDSLAARSISLSHGECLEIVARQFRFSDWNTFSARFRAAPSQDLSCSFCGKSRHDVRTLAEGGCRNRVAPACVFICDECVALCAQVNAEALGGAAGVQNPAKS